MLAALDQGVHDRPGGRAKAKLAATLNEALAKLWTSATTDATLIRLCARAGHAAALTRALALATNPQVPAANRQAMLQVLADVEDAACVAPLLKLLEGTETDAIYQATLSVLQQFDHEAIAEATLRVYPRLSAPVRRHAIQMLLSRRPWARTYLREIDQGRYSAKDVAVEQLRPVALLHDSELDDLVRKHWGGITSGTPEEKLAEVRRLNNDLRAFPGNPAMGKELFGKRCAECHRLFGEGSPIGPDLTYANRKDRDYLLVSIVDPSAVIRKEYMSYIVQTVDGRVLTGLLGEQTPQSITLLGAKNERTTISRKAIESMRESAVSLMPENLLRDLKPDEVRHLFSYLQSEVPSGPVPHPTPGVPRR
jgi:putative heme-binding domain-containing protein